MLPKSTIDAILSLSREKDYWQRKYQEHVKDDQYIRILQRDNEALSRQKYELEIKVQMLQERIARTERRMTS